MSDAAILTTAIEKLRAGRAQDALVLLSSVPLAARSEAVFRTLATAQAMQHAFVEAEREIQFALQAARNSQRAPEPATLAISARIADDANNLPLAFSRYAALVKAQPSVITFWRSLWRIAIQLGDETLKTEALALTRSSKFDFTVDASLSAVVAGVWARRCSDGRDVEALAQAMVRARQSNPDDSKLRAQHLEFLIELDPQRARELIQTEPETAILSASTAELALQLSAALKLPAWYDDEADVDFWRTRYADALAALAQRARTESISPSVVTATPFLLAYTGRNDVSVQSVRGDLLCSMVKPLTPIGSLARQHAHEKLRIGFVSKHIRDCTVGHYFEAFMRSLADAETEVYLYPCGVSDGFTEIIASAAAVCRKFALSAGDDLRDDTLVGLASLIAADELDVLVFPEIGMEPLIEKLAAMRIAPLQCALWGHPTTTGLPTIDVFFSAQSMEPANAQSHYRERLELLPGLGTSYPEPPVPTPKLTTRAALSLPADIPLLVCAQSSFKWRPKFVDAVAKILRRNANAKLVIFRSRDAVAAHAFDLHLSRALSRAGVAATERVLVLPERSRPDFLAVLSVCDLALDTFDFSGGNTSLDAFSVALPVLALPGEFMRGRQTTAMLEKLGCAELIADDPDDFVDRATRLLADSSARIALGEKIRLNAPSLFDDPRPLAALRSRLHELASGTNGGERNDS